MMKKLLLLILLSTSFLFGMSQSAIIYGTVTSNTTSSPIPNQQVFISTDSMGGFFYYNMVTTDANGYYADTIALSPATQVMIFAQTIDPCTGQMVTNQGMSTNSPILANFSICTNVIGCQAMFVAYPDSMSPMTYNFIDISQGNPTSWSWDFGDGSTSLLQNPQHTYASQGIYGVTLTISDGAGCTSSFFDSIFVWNGTSTIDAGVVATIQPTGSPLPGSLTNVEVVVVNFGTDTLVSIPVNYELPGFLPTIVTEVINATLLPGDSIIYTFNTQLTVPGASGMPTWDLCAYTTVPGDLNFFNDGGCITLNNPSGCLAAFMYYPDSNSLNTIHFYDISMGNPTTWAWDFGDGSTSSAQHPSHTYANSGVYGVTLTISSAIPGCTSTFYDSVLVGNSFPCYSYFNYNVSALNNLTYTFTSTNANPAIQSTWDFGDGTFGTGAVVTHTFAQAGFYQVCLSESGGGMVCNPYCDLVNAGGGSSLGVFFGMVTLNNIPADMGTTVYLIEYDSIAQTLTAVDTTQVDSGGFYFFVNTNYSTYFVKAALQPSSPHYSNFIPTYHMNSLYWSTATPFYFNQQMSVYPANIEMVQGVNPGGPGFIGGNISNGANKMIGGGKGPMENVQVILLDENSVPQSFTMSDANGDFAFNNIALGSYKLLVDIINVPSDTAFVVLDPTNTSSTGTQFTIDNNAAIITTNIHDLGSNIESFRLLGNPANESVQIELISKINGTISLSLRNVIGQEVSRTEVDFNGGSNIIQIPTGDLEEGLYFVKANFNGKSKSLKIVIEH